MKLEFKELLLIVNALGAAISEYQKHANDEKLSEQMRTQFQRHADQCGELLERIENALDL